MALNEQFSSRWGIVLASLGMAIGAGNLWRFPRLAGQYGGTFLLLWFLFLLVWSIPILLAEFSIGKMFKKGVVGSYGSLVGKPFTWMGVFIALCTLGITFYYSVVTAWGIRYLGFSAMDVMNKLTQKQVLAEKLAVNSKYLDLYWKTISEGSYVTLYFHVVVVIIGVFILYRGIQKGLERVNRILIPSLFIMLIIIGLTAINIGNGVKGLEYMFTINPTLFSEPKVWIEALSQSAWSTGAGWGLMMTISSYSRENEDVTLNIFISGFGNNTASIVAGMAILPSVFALATTNEEAVQYLQAGNQALTFSVIPKLFTQVSGGIYLSLIFFLAFTLAAFSSLLTMLEFFIKIIGDLGFTRTSSAVRAAIFCIIFGIPSAYSLDFFNNQDWVWGIGLVISGLFIIFSVLKYGILKFKAEFIDLDSDFKVKNWYFQICMLINIPFGLVLIYWWMSQGYDPYPWRDAEGNWNVISIYSNATIISQWGLVILIGLIFNGLIYRKFVERK